MCVAHAPHHAAVQESVRNQRRVVQDALAKARTKVEHQSPAPLGLKSALQFPQLVQGTGPDGIYPHVANRCRRIDPIRPHFFRNAAVSQERVERDHGAGAVSRLVRNEPCLDTLALEELQDEVAHLVVAHRRQQRRPQSETLRADADVGRTAADVRVEAGDLGQRHPNLVRVQVDGAASHGQDVETRLGHAINPPVLRGGVFMSQTRARNDAPPAILSGYPGSDEWQCPSPQSSARSPYE